MLGNAFAPTMRAAQAGDERAFARLWRDANPHVVRYLRVIGVEDPYDSACEGWISIVRGVNGFEGDEKDWRLWICSCARMCAEESSLRASWSPFRSRTSMEAAPDDSLDDIDLGELMGPGTGDDPRHRDVNATISALRGLPMGQGEVVDLRFGWGLPSEDVAGLVGLDSAKVRRAEVRALQRLQTPADLLEWSLNAPATPAELADERIATAVFRSAPRGSGNPVGAARIIALGTGRPAGAFHRSGHSRTALLGIAALSASVMSFGGLSAAAYVGVLPAPVQSFAHDVVGAPAPAAPTVRASSVQPGGRALPTVGVGPDATAKAAPGLCRAWSADKAKGTPATSSVAFRNLSRAAGGDGAVDAYCATVLAPGGQGQGGPTAGTKTHAPHSPTTRPGSTRTPGSPTRATSARVPGTKVPSTRVPNTRIPSTKGPSTKAPSTKAPSTKAPSTKAVTGKPTTSKNPQSTSTTAPRVTTTPGNAKQATPSAVVAPVPTASVDEPSGRGAGQPTPRR